MQKKSYFCSVIPLKRGQGSLAQLVQSIALTRRGSLVRVQQFPRYKGVTVIVAPFFIRREETDLW